MNDLPVEWYEATYPCGRMGDESQPQFVSYMICPVVNDLEPAAEVFESLVGMGGYVLARNPYLSERQYRSWHQTVDECYGAAYRWASRKVAAVGDCRETEPLCEAEAIVRRLIPGTGPVELCDRGWWQQAIDTYEHDQRRKYFDRTTHGMTIRQRHDRRALMAPRRSPLSVRAWVGGGVS